MGDEVVGEDRQAVEIPEAHDAGEREVRRHDLGALVEAVVGEHRHAAGQLCGQPLRRSPCRKRQPQCVTLPEESPERTQGLGVERDQLVVATLPEDVCQLFATHRAQLGRRPGAERAEAVGESSAWAAIRAHEARTSSQMPRRPVTPAVAQRWP
ncbi:MAG TPA: hypothetical protein VHZ75_03030 [Solirubrobacteraceae bacterium]|nr:hypothetical protein [Solirubrobacteraceae bacterium]